MSAILLIKEMPKTCKECPCQMMLVCVPADEDIDEYVDPSKTKPNWCPLSPLPKPITEYEVKVSCDYEPDYALGWNECLDEIMGEIE